MKKISALNLLVGFSFQSEGTDAPITFQRDTAEKIFPFVPQVTTALEGVGRPIVDAEVVALPGQGTGAILCVAALEGVRGCNLPKIALSDPSKVGAAVGELDLADYRHAQVRPFRGDISDGEPFAGYTVFDFAGRGFNPNQLAALAEALGIDADHVRIIPVGMTVQRNPARPFEAVDGSNTTLNCLLARAKEGKFNMADLTSGRIVMIPPGMGTAAVADAATVYGLSEAWPMVVRLAGFQPFPFAEVVRPHDLRGWGMEARERLSKAAPKATVPTATLSGPIPEAFRTALAALAAEHDVEVRG